MSLLVDVALDLGVSPPLVFPEPCALHVWVLAASSLTYARDVAEVPDNAEFVLDRAECGRLLEVCSPRSSGSSCTLGVGIDGARDMLRRPC